MNEPTVATIDANEAVASVACRLSEVVATYPITPASAMGEHAEEWSVTGRPNLWGSVPDVVEMQSEGGAAGALKGRCRPARWPRRSRRRRAPAGSPLTPTRAAGR